MLSPVSDLPTDAPTLQSLVLELFGTLQEKERRIDQLSSQLEALKRHLFGRRSEKLDADQLRLDLGELSVAEVEEVEASSAEEPAREGYAGAMGVVVCPRICRASGSSTTCPSRSVPVRSASSLWCGLAKRCRSN